MSTHLKLEQRLTRMGVEQQYMLMHMFMIKEGSPDSMSKIFYGKYRGKKQNDPINDEMKIPRLFTYY